MNEVIHDQLNDIQNLCEAVNTARWDCGGLILQMIVRLGKNRRIAAKDVGISEKRLTLMIKGDCTIPLNEYLAAANSLNTMM